MSTVSYSGFSLARRTVAPSFLALVEYGNFVGERVAGESAAAIESSII